MVHLSMNSFMNLKGFNHQQCPYATCILLSLTIIIVHLFILSKLLTNEQSCCNSHKILARFTYVLLLLSFPMYFTWNLIQNKAEVPIWYWFGMKLDGIFESVVSSFFLTFIFFFGPICLYCLDVEEINLKSIIGAFNIKSKLTGLIWLHYIISPVFVELTFRACIIPVLLQCFPPVPTIFINAGFSGIAHYNSRTKEIIKSCTNDTSITVFQFVYSIVFGAHSALLFIYTGNIIAPIVANSFFNHMGHLELFQISEPRRCALFTMSFMGLVLLSALITFRSTFMNMSNLVSNQNYWTTMNQCYTTESQY